MSAMPQEITSIVEACKSATARCREAMALAHQAQALTPGLSIWLRIEDELVGAFLDAERNAAKAIAEHLRRLLGPRGLPLPADTFVDLLPEPLDRQDRRALALRFVNRPEEAPTTLDLESLWHAMLARFPSEEAAHDVARFALAKRFREAFFGRKHPAPEPHRDGIKLKIYASQEAHWLSQPQYCLYSANQLFAGLDLIDPALRRLNFPWVADVRAAWTKKTLVIRRWSSCMSGASRWFACTGKAAV